MVFIQQCTEKMLQPSTCAESEVDGDRCGQGVLCLKLLTLQCFEDMLCSHQSGEKKGEGLEWFRVFRRKWIDTVMTICQAS